MALVGILLGPMYPLVLGVLVQLLLRRLQMNSIAFVSAMGNSGDGKSQGEGR